MAYRGDGATAQQRFDEKVASPDENGCRLWTGGTHKKGPLGYGLFFADGQMRPAHRWLYEQTHGALPKNIDVCHSCDVRRCVNLDHLFAGTRRENMQDAVWKGRTSRKPRHVGEAHPMATLTEDQVKAIRLRHKAGESAQAISRDFTVTRTQIERIINRASWRHI